MECGAHFFKVHEKAELPDVSAEELEELLATTSAPGRDVAADFCSPARTSLTAPLSFLKAGANESHNFCCSFWLLCRFPFLTVARSFPWLLMAVFFPDCAHGTDAAKCPGSGGKQIS